MTEFEDEASYKSPDGFNISAELSLTKFLNHKNADKYGGECIHVIPDHDGGEIRVYRSVSKNAGGPKIMTRIPGVASTGNADGFPEPDGWFLTGGKGETFLTMLRCFRGETTADGIRIEWWGRNNSPMMNKSDLNQESLIVTYRTGSGREEMIHIDETYKVRSHMMAWDDRKNF